MKKFDRRPRRGALDESQSQSFQVTPLENNTGQDPDRINAHDLFAHYTADIIKDDVIFAR